MRASLRVFILSLSGGAAALVLRLLQNRTGFEADTALPIPGNLPGLLLPLFLVGMGVVLVLFCRSFSRQRVTSAFPAAFSAGEPLPLSLAVGGAFLMALSGIIDLLCRGGSVVAMTSQGPVRLSFSSLSAASSAVMGGLSILCAACLFLAAVACRSKPGREASPISPLVLLVPVLCLVVRLVMVYRIDSVNPVLSAYYVGLLSLVMLTIGFFRLSAFGFQAGQPRLLAIFTALSVLLALPAAGDGPLSSSLFHLGSAGILLGFFLMLQEEPAA